MANELLGKLTVQENSAEEAAAALAVIDDKAGVEATPVNPDDSGINQDARNAPVESSADGISGDTSAETSRAIREKFEHMGVPMAMAAVGQAAGMEWAYVNRDNPEIMEYASYRAFSGCDDPDAYTVGGVRKDEVLGDYFRRQLLFAPYLNFDENADESEVLPQGALWWIYGWQDGAEMGLRVLDGTITL